jgi:hypothetical protein
MRLIGLVLTVSCIAAPLALAQPAQTPRIGIGTQLGANYDAFLQGLREAAGLTDRMSAWSFARAALVNVIRFLTSFPRSWPSRSMSSWLDRPW